MRYLERTCQRWEVLTISAKDFGPIIEGSVDLKPLTVFVGRSNTGKSYFATLVYALIQSLDAFGVLPYSELIHHGYLRTTVPGALQMALKDREGLELDRDLIRAIDGCTYVVDHKAGRPETMFISDLPSKLLSLLNTVFSDSFGPIAETLNDDLTKYYGDVVGLRSRRATFTEPQIEFSRSQPAFEIKFEWTEDDVLGLSDKSWDIRKAALELPGEVRDALWEEIARRAHAPGHARDLPYVDFLVALINNTTNTFLEGLPRRCYYLPAARSGIAQGHKVIASMLVRQSSFAGIRPMEIPTLSGVVTDFMGHMLTLEPRRGGHSQPDIEEAVAFLEGEVVHGSIAIERTRDLTYPEISYSPTYGQPSMGNFPLSKTSSMVSELAPIILFLKYLVRPGDLVILEEPESHLHPASQRQMARGIARLVNAGVKVIITTHSDYFVGQLNNLIKVSRASDRKRRNEGFDKADCLKPEDVGAYHFKFDEELGGSAVKELTIDPGYGIPEDEFGEVSLALYEETVSLQRIRAK